MKPGYTERKILIWGKTYPELSKKYIETVCTAGVLESGKPVRLYPITYRYLNDEQFKLLPSGSPLDFSRLQRFPPRELQDRLRLDNAWREAARH